MNAPVLPLLPNAKEPFRERLEWLTDVSVALDGTEVRRPARAYPRYTYSGLFSFFKADERQLLAALRQSSEVLVPLAPHSFRSPQLTPDAGLAALSPLAVALSPSGVATYSIPVQPAVAAASKWLAPAAVARITEAVEIEHMTSTVARGRLSFQLANFQEAVPAYAGPTSGGLFLLPARANWGTTVRERITPTSESADFGNLRAVKRRYAKRSISITVSLFSRDAILAFRQFAFAMQGRAGSFRWTFPGDGVEKAWRLANDVVEIEYLSINAARCALEVIEV